MDLDGFFWFVNEFRRQFQRDGLLDEILARLWKVFLKLTSTFRIHRRTGKEAGGAVRELVPGSGIVEHMLECFTNWKVYDPILKKIRAHFSKLAGPEHSFWFCECAYHTRAYLREGAMMKGLRRLEKQQKERNPRKQALFDFFHRIELFGAHYSNSLLNMDCQINEGFFEYNRRVML